MGNSLVKDIDVMLRTLRREGCDVRVTKRGHWRVTRPGHQPITMAKSPSDRRVLMDIRSDIKRYLGIEL